MAQRRFLTIVGPGGIGKTTVAVAVAEAVSASYADGVWFVGLASLADPALVLRVASAVLGISPSGSAPLSGVGRWLRDKQTLIVLDNCEHVIDAAARAGRGGSESGAASIHLATSREPLRAEGEWLHRLASLEVPPESDDLTAAEVLRVSGCPTVRRAGHGGRGQLRLGDTDIPAVLEICRQARRHSARASSLRRRASPRLGVREVASRLDDRFGLLTSWPAHGSAAASDAPRNPRLEL